MEFLRRKLDALKTQVNRFMLPDSLRNSRGVVDDFETSPERVTLYKQDPGIQKLASEFLQTPAENKHGFLVGKTRFYSDGQMKALMDVCEDLCARRPEKQG
jgi:hypothetical protein